MMQRALTCACYRLLDSIAVERYNLAPELLGRLRPIVRDLLPGQPPSYRHPSPMAGSSSPGTMPSAAALPLVPTLLFEAFALWAVLRET